MICALRIYGGDQFLEIKELTQDGTVHVTCGPIDDEQSTQYITMDQESLNQLQSWINEQLNKFTKPTSNE